MGSALSSYCVEGLIQIQCTHVECPPPAIDSPSGHQSPAGRVAAPSHWSPAMSVHTFSNAGIGDGGQSKATALAAPVLKAQKTALPCCMCPPGNPYPTGHPPSHSPAQTSSPFPWLCPDAQGHPRLCKQAPEGTSPPRCPGGARVIVTCQHMERHIFRRQKTPSHHSC